MGNRHACGSTVIARSSCDEAIQSRARGRTGLLRRFAPRNDGEADEGMKQPCVYIMANRRNGTLYTGVTSNPPRRFFEHREGIVKGFSKKYQCKMLVWYELYESMYEAITREKQIKAGSRAK